MIFEQTKFKIIIQEPNESVDSFITSLYSLAEYCGYGILHDELIRDRIIVGIRDKTFRETSAR